MSNKISNNVKTQIVTSLIEPMYFSDIKEIISGKKGWRLTGQIFETISKVLVAVGGIVSFSSGYFSNPILGFIAGSISTVSLATLQFSSYSYTQNKKKTAELNILLQKLNIDTIPDIDEVNKNNIQREIIDNHNGHIEMSSIYVNDESKSKEDNQINASTGTGTL